MTICFIHSHTRMKGPFEVRDATNKQCIKIGDICMKETEEGIIALLVHSSNNHWNACRRIGSVPQQTGWKANSILFSFDGTAQRQGKPKELEQLTQFFQGTSLFQMLRNAVSILNYEVDFWNLSYLSPFYTLSSPHAKLHPIQEFPNTSVSNSNVQEQSPGPGLFQHYLDEKSILLLKELEKQGLPWRKIYQHIRVAYPRAFRQAMLQFVKEHPDRSIYDT